MQHTKSVDDLLKLYYRGDKNALEVISACGESLSENDGKNLLLLLDGYDEYPEDLQKDSLISEILQRLVLTFCGLLISSRPHASVDLREKATTRVDILGFTETE